MPTKEKIIEVLVNLIRNSAGDDQRLADTLYTFFTKNTVLLNQLNPQSASLLIKFLNRTQINGNEARTMLLLQEQLNSIAQLQTTSILAAQPK